MIIQINLGSMLLENALRDLLAREPEGYQVRADAGSHGIEGFQPDFIIVDCHTIGRIMSVPRNGAKIVLMNYGLSEEEIASLLLSYRIDGVLAASTDPRLFKKALNSISRGQIWIDNGKIKALLRHAESAAGVCQDGGLSKKERDIVLLISQGLTNREIASIACVSEQTVKTHISRIFRKLNVSRRSQLVPLALKLKVINTQ